MATVTLSLSACVKIILGCADMNLHVSDSNFNSCLSVENVKIGEEMILFKIGMVRNLNSPTDWHSLCTTLNTLYTFEDNLILVIERKRKIFS